jgi:hypothetical protein
VLGGLDHEGHPEKDAAQRQFIPEYGRVLLNDDGNLLLFSDWRSIPNSGT